MPEPTLTPSERTLLTNAVNQITAAQAAYRSEHGKFRQARSGRDAELQALGLSGATLALARSAGTTANIHEYVGPNGVGWELELQLVRDGVTLRRVVHVGPETWRDLPWTSVTRLVGGV